MAQITEAQARRIARSFAAMTEDEPDSVAKVGDPDWLAHVLQRFSEGTDNGMASAAEERQAQRESVRDAVWSWMDRVYARCPRLELGENMKLEILADQSGYAETPDRSDSFEAFTFRVETTVTEGEF
jgi:hypothetical protein